MKRITKVILMIMVISLCIEPMFTFSAKQDRDWNILNFAPTVDFELKEKKKVDVIVDVGTTKLSMDEVNSLVNQHLRPKLQEAGYDYKLNVEKSSEGATKLYYYKPAYRSNGQFINGSAYEYDTLTRQSQKLPDFKDNNSYINIDTYYTGSSYYDPYNNLLILYTGGVLYKDLNDKHSETIKRFEPINHDNLFNGYVGRTFQISHNLYYVVTTSGYRLVEVKRNSNGNIEIEEKSYYPSSIRAFNGGVDWRSFWIPDGKDYFYMWDVNQQSNPEQIMRFKLNANGSLVVNEYGSPMPTAITRLDGNLNHPTLDNHVQNSNIGILPNSRSIVYGLNKNKQAIEGMENSPTNVGALEMYNPYTNRYSIIAHSIPYHVNGGEVSITHDGFMTLSDDRIVYNWCSFDTTIVFGYADRDCEVRIVDDIEKPSDYRIIYEYEISSAEMSNSSTRAAKIPSFIGEVGNKIVFTLGNGDNAASERKLLMLDVDTGEVVLIDTYGNAERNKIDHYVMFRYPEWYIANKRYIVDILDEVPYRSDAEKFYVRIDEQDISHLNASKNFAKTISALSKQQISYIQIGNEKNIDKSTKLQTTLSQDLMHYSVAQIGQSLNQIGKYITERKEVDLHVLVAQSGQTKAAIESSVQTIVQQLKAENIMVTPHYHYGTTSSKLQELYNNVAWNENKNQYVLFLNTAAMSELTENYLEGAVETLASNYAHYLQIGSSTNRSIAESIISQNEGRGKFYAGTSYSTYYADMKQYIIDTALKNPKRVNDVLVLQHDPVTNEYSAEINVNMFYDDYEKDRKRNERFKTTQDPTVYENHTGLMNGIGQYLEAPTTRFTKVGLYEMTMQAQDEPIANPAFSEYWKWSQDSLSLLRLYVHRAPVAKFSAIVRPNKSLSITDYSYDLDRYSRINHGIVEWEWKWKKVDDLNWTTGQLTTLANNTDYFIALRVKDLDGAWSNEYIQFVTTNPFNQPPVALFKVEPATVSHRANATITDQSYDPDGDEIIKREWIVKKDGVEIWNKDTQPTKTQLQSAATSKGLDQLGDYQISLRVTDALGELSEWHTEWLEIINYPPLANFEDILQTDRDSLNKLVNTTVEPDQDGDPVSYTWKLRYKDKDYSLGATKNPQFTIKNYGLGKAAIGTWEVTLQARDPLGASSTLTKMFEVINHAPIARISSSPPYAYIDENYSFTSNDDDPDTEDRASLKYYWKLTPPSGKARNFITKDVTNIMFDEKGTHTMEHWVEDQLGAKSEIAKVEFNVLNKRPVADFTRNPITTYRNIDIEFKSLGTDFDGWIEAYRYELIRDGLSPLTLSTDADFIRAFSSIGTYDIRHTVTDNDGASDSITKKIYIVNRAPKAEVTQPSGTSAATATEFNTLNPTIRWTMTDADNDPQVQYQLQLKNQAGTVLRTTAVTTTVNKYFTIPNGWLTEGPTYRVAVRVYDGYEWSDYSSDKYFFILLNRPPVASFTVLPVTKYEGDTITVTSTSTDPDNDPLEHRYVWTKPNGTTETFTTANITRRTLEVGQHRIQLTVTDPGNLSDTTTQTFTVLPLTITGTVDHTDQWKLIHQQIGNLPNQFYSGERFMLKATVTDHDAKSVKVNFRGMQINNVLLELTENLTEISSTVWNGSIFSATMTNSNTLLKNGLVTFEFIVEYENGVIKTDEVQVEIIGSVYDALEYSRTK